MVDYNNPPLSVELTWPTPNYVNPHTQGPALEIVGITLTVLAFIFVIVRIYSRALLTRTFGLDDAFIIPSMFFAIATTTLVIYANKHLGLGHHIWDYELKWLIPFRKISWATQWTYAIGTGFVKLSVLMFYRRLQRGSYTTTYLIMTWVGIAYNGGLMIAYPIYLCLFCNPINAYWMKFNATWAKTHSHHCARQDVGLPVVSALSLVGDVYSTILPLLLVHGLHMSRQRKWSLYPLFGIGFFIIAAGIIRAILTYTATHTYDSPWKLYDLWLWTLIEMQLAIVVASLPALKPFFVRHIAPVMTNYAKKYATNSPTGKRSIFSRDTQLTGNSGVALNSIVGSKWRNDGYEDVEKLAGNGHTRRASERALSPMQRDEGTIKPFDGIYHETTFTIESSKRQVQPMRPDGGRVRIREVMVPQTRTTIEGGNGYADRSSDEISVPTTEERGQAEETVKSTM